MYCIVTLYKAETIYRAPVVYFDSGFFYFGGSTQTSELGSTIARLDSKTWEWLKIGDILQARMGHNVIEIHGQFLVIGGYYRFQAVSTEKCIYSSGEIKCTAQLPELAGYDIYPELFHVPDDFCRSS